MDHQKSYLVIGIILGSLLTLAAGELYLNRNSIWPQKTEKNPVVIYTERIGGIDAQNRNWPTIHIYQKVGTDPNTPPQLLASNIGKVGEYPHSFTLSSDKKSLYINLESKLQKLDLKTKVLTDFFIPKKQVQSFLISQDGKRMYIWDQIYASSDDFEYALHQIDLRKNTDTILKEGILPNGTFIFINNEPNDGILTLGQSLGEAWQPWYFDLKTKELQKMPNTTASPSQIESNYGEYLAVESSTVPSLCNDFFGTLSSTYDLLDIPSGKKVDSFGTNGMTTDILGYSPDDSEVLFMSYPSLEKATTQSDEWSDIQQECGSYNPPKSYYRMVIGTGKPIQVTDHKKLLESWGDETSNFATDYRTVNNRTQYVVSYKGQDFFLPVSKQSVIEVFEQAD